MSNSVSSDTPNDENREALKTIPVRRYLAPDGTAYVSFGSEPFTPNNQLRYKTFQARRTSRASPLTIRWSSAQRRSATRHRTYSGAAACRVITCILTARISTADANGYLATQPHYLDRAAAVFQPAVFELPGPQRSVQELKVGTAAPMHRRVAAAAEHDGHDGGQIDVPRSRHRVPNAKADSLTFRDENGQPVQYSSGQMPAKNILGRHGLA